MKTFTETTFSMRPRGITRLRKALSMTEARLGQLLGVHEMTVSKWERGELSPTLWQAHMLRVFAKARDRDEMVGKRVVGYMLEQGVPFALYKMLSVAYYD
ncbi:MAG: helix-turn-helix domain-containing protein [bacterium]